MDNFKQIEIPDPSLLRAQTLYAYILLGNYGDPEVRKCVISEAFTSTATINKHSQFAILATAGFWSVIGVDEAFYIVKSLPSLPQNVSSSLSE